MEQLTAEKMDADWEAVRARQPVLKKPDNLDRGKYPTVKNSTVQISNKERAKAVWWRTLKVVR